MPLFDSAMDRGKRRGPYHNTVDYELDELDELDELLLEELTDVDELLLEELDELDELLDSSCMQMMDSRSPERGPGNCKLPVWKFRTSATDSSPLSKASTNFAWKI